jgi:hypothetical protein
MLSPAMPTGEGRDVGERHSEAPTGGRHAEPVATDAELVEARRACPDGDFADDYRRWRPMIERSLAWLVRPGRRVAYRGLGRNRRWLSHGATAVNLRRLIHVGLTHTHRWQLAA